MSAPDSSPQPSSELDEVLRREAAFRLKTLQQFIGLEAQLRTQGERLDELNHEVGRKDTYIHELHLEREKLLGLNQQLEQRDAFIFALQADRERLLGLNRQLEEKTAYIHRLHQERKANSDTRAAMERDLEGFALALQQSEERLQKAQLQLRSVESSFFWQLCRPFHAFERWLQPLRRRPGPVFLPSADFDYHLTPTLFRLYRQPTFTVRGWACPRQDRPVSAVRIRIGDRTFEGTYGLSVAEEGALTSPANPATGFEVPIEVPPGRSWLQLEFAFGQEWVSLFNIPLWRP